jgi:hypothetical protein
MLLSSKLPLASWAHEATKYLPKNQLFVTKSANHSEDVTFARAESMLVRERLILKGMRNVAHLGKVLVTFASKHGAVNEIAHCAYLPFGKLK